MHPGAWVEFAPMTPNPFHQAARYVARLDPPGFLRWLVPRLSTELSFHSWLDTRSIPSPGAPERPCDTVAAMTDSSGGPMWWAMPIAFQARPDAELFGRMLEYLGRLWLEVRPPGMSRGHFATIAAVINLTGAGQTSRDMVLGSTRFRTCLTAAERNLREEDAAEMLRQIADGYLTLSLLPLIPLMLGGAETAIIERWKELAQQEPDPPRRADYAALALVFAELSDCRPIWKQSLEGWNVEQSVQVLEWQAEAEKRGLARGKGDALLRVLHTRFSPGVAADVERAVRETSDPEQLDQWLDVAVTASTLAVFRRRVGLASPDGGKRPKAGPKRSGKSKKR